MSEFTDEAMALAGLVRVCEPPSASLALFVSRVGPVAAWKGVLDRRAPRAVLAATAARTQNVTQEVLIRRAEQDLVDCREGGRAADRSRRSVLAGRRGESFEGALARGVRGAGPPVALYVRGRTLADLPGTG